LTNQRDSGIRKENQPRLAPIRAYALYEYGRLRAVPKLTDLFQSEDQRLSGEVVSCLSHLLTPEEIDALVRCAGAGGDQTKRKMCAGALESVFNRLGLTQGEYARKSLAGKQTLIDAAIKQTEEKYQLKPGDRRLSHKELLKAAAEWKASDRITGGTYEWVEDRHVLAACTPAEIPLLLDVMAGLLPSIGCTTCVDSYSRIFANRLEMSLASVDFHWLRGSQWQSGGLFL
jgi:hypothetical protein